MKSCPACNSPRGLRKIFYGLPDDPVDEEEHAIGACCVSHDDPTIKCMECGWKGCNADHSRKLGKEISTVALQDISKMSDVEIDTYAKRIWQNLVQEN